MDIKIKIIKVEYPIKSNSSYGNFAIAVDFQYIDSFKANTFKYAWTKKQAVELYKTLKNKLNKIISIYEL